MNFNNIIIKKSNLLSFLVCNDKFVKFYKKNNWKKLNKKKFKVADSLLLKNGMIYNEINLNKNYLFYIKK